MRFTKNGFQNTIGLMVHLHWLSPGLGDGLMDCMVLCRTFHTAPEQGQGRLGYIPTFQDLKLVSDGVCYNGISMAFRCPVLVPDTASVNSFCIILVPVPLPDTVVSVIIPWPNC